MCRYRHFVTRIFPHRTSCHTEILSNGHFVTYDFLSQEILLLVTRTFCHRIFCCRTFCHRTFCHRTFGHKKELHKQDISSQNISSQNMSSRYILFHRYFVTWTFYHTINHAIIMTFSLLKISEFTDSSGPRRGNHYEAIFIKVSKQCLKMDLTRGLVNIYGNMRRGNLHRDNQLFLFFRHTGPPVILNVVYTGPPVFQRGI